MSHVDFMKGQCCMSLSLVSPNFTCQIEEKVMSHVTLIFSLCRMSLSPLSYVGFKKWPYRLVDLRGQGPSYAKAAIHLRTGSCRQQLLLSLQSTLKGRVGWLARYSS